MIIDRPRSRYYSSNDPDDFLIEWDDYFSKEEQEKLLYPYYQEQKRRNQNVDFTRFGSVAQFGDDCQISVIDTGTYAELKIRSEGQRGGFIRKLPECKFPGDPEPIRPYVLTKDIAVNSDGVEVLPEFKFMRSRAKSRKDNMRQVKQACNKFKWLVRKNQNKVKKFITLTYAENMTDVKRLYEDYRRFVQKLYRRFPAITGYLVAFEPQKRGAWHAHLLLLSDSPLLRTKKGKLITNKIIHELWGHGFTKTSDVKSVRDLGAYITSYLVNVKSGRMTKKGARLALYPERFRFLRNSRNVDKPEFSSHVGKISDIQTKGEYTLLYDYEQVRKFGTRYIRSRVVGLQFRSDSPQPS